MTNFEKLVIKALTVGFYSFSILVLIGLIFWFYPRTMVKLATQMQTSKTEYSYGERIFVKGETWTNVDSNADFNVRLLCDGVKYSYDQINNFSVSKQVKPVSYNFPYAPLPEYIPKDSTCRIETTTTYSVEVLPFLTKKYTYVFNSNEFQIKGE